MAAANGHIALIDPMSRSSTLRGLGVFAFLGAALCAIYRPENFFPVYRFVFFAVLAAPLGSLIFYLIYLLSGGRWGETLQAGFAVGIARLPWIWLGMLVMLFAKAQQPGISPWAYDGKILQALRIAVVAIFLFSVAGILRRKFLTPSRDPVGYRWLPPFALIALVFLLHLLADDWLASVQAGWHSTAFPAVWLTGAAVTGFSAAVLFTLRTQNISIAEGKRPLGVDWGNLLLASSVFWCYLFFMQFLIVWSGDLPREVSYYLVRTAPLGLAAVLAIVVLHFVVPFFTLLGRDRKKSPAVLRAITAALIVAQVVYLAWALLPGQWISSLWSVLALGACVICGATILADFYLPAPAEEALRP